MKKVRLDHLLAARELSESQEQARKEIMAGWVRVKGETIREPARQVDPAAEVTVERPGGPYVSRGGEKLKKAIDLFAIDLKGAVAVDLGASTGGFTDCMLQHGAAFVYSVDVGYGQLDYNLRNDPRVRPLDRCNARDIGPELFDRQIDFITADLSFISILKVADRISALFRGARGVFLIKPQFEADESQHIKGVVRDPVIHKFILVSVLKRLREKNFRFLGLTFSPIRGPAGNIEFLLYFGLGTACEEVIDAETAAVECVDKAHEVLFVGN